MLKVQAAGPAARLTDTVELDSVQGDLASVVAKAVEPAHVSVRVSGRWSLLWADLLGAARGPFLGGGGAGWGHGS